MNSQCKILLCLFFSANAVFAGKETEGKICQSTEARFGFEAMSYEANLGEKIRTTSVHSDDLRFFSGETTTGDPGSSFGLAPNIGLFRLIGSDDLRFVGGFSCRWNLTHYDDGFREGAYSNRQHVSDMRPASNGSFVFTQVIPGEFTLIPSVGLEGKIKNIRIGADVSFPYMEWEAHSGHDRWSEWETVQSSSWKGFGTRYAGNLSFDLNGKADALFLSFFYEEYSPEFAGESAGISGIGGFIGLIHRW